MYETNLSAADVAAVTRNNDGNGMFGNDWAWIIILLLFGYGGRGFGGFGGFGGGCGNPATQADLAAGFNNSAVLASLNDIKLGQANAINYNNQGFNGLNTALLQGFNGVERGFCDISHQLSDCCCATQRAIDGINYNLATQTRDVIENANANSRAILDALNTNYIRTLENENNSLRLSASQSAQNAVLMAAMDANKAEILRRTGAECPTAAYIVQPPQPVTFPTNGCGQFNGCCGGF